jgi:ABC-type polysaccharide/polyol phosphate export permease
VTRRSPRPWGIGRDSKSVEEVRIERVGARSPLRLRRAFCLRFSDMKRQRLMKEYLGALWDRFFQPILVVIDVLGFFSILCIVVDDNYEFIALLVLGVVWFASGFCLFRKQRERIVELEASLANERDSVDVVLTMLMQEIGNCSA